MDIYEYNGATFQFADDDVPAGAVKVKAAEDVKNKEAEKPANKSKGTKTK